MRRTTRILWLAMLATSIAVGQTVAPEHVHARDEHHSHAIVHRHLTAHDARPSPDGARFDDDDAHVVWLTAVWWHAAAHHGPTLTSVPARFSPLTLPHDRWTPLALDESAPPHGPPRSATPSRAPPFSRLS